MFVCSLCKDGKAIRVGLCSRCGAEKVYGLGDYVAVFLDRIGITKQRVSRITGGCGCQKRQEALNTFGARVSQFFSRRKARHAKDPPH